MIDISPHDLKTVKRLLADYFPNVEARVFGSRYHWTAKDYSDLDIVLVGEKKLDWRKLSRLREALAESNVPFRVDVLDWHVISPEFQQVIERGYEVIQKSSSPSSKNRQASHNNTSVNSATARAKAIAVDDESSDWQETTLGEVLELKRGYDLPKRLREPGNVPVVTSSGISDYHAQAKVSGPGVVTGRYGTIGEVYYIEEDFWPHNTSLYVRDFKGNDPRFISYFLRTINYQAFSDKAAVPGVNRNHLHMAKISLPPVREQKAIAAVLSAFDDKIELNRQINATLEEMARALFKSWFVDFDPVRRNQAGQPIQPYDHLFPDKLVVDENGRELPEGWRVNTLNDCCVRVENGGTPKRNEPSFWTPPEIPWLTSGEVRQSIVIGTENYISTKGLESSSAKIWPIGTTVVAMYGATAGETTMLAQELCTNQACCGLIPNKYMQYFNFLLISQSTESLARQARGSAQQNLSQKLISRFPAIIPKTIVLETFDHLVKPLFDKWVANLYESRTLAELRDTLLPRLMSGQLRVRQFAELPNNKPGKNL